jgi:hypothetical protein
MQHPKVKIPQMLEMAAVVPQPFFNYISVKCTYSSSFSETGQTGNLELLSPSPSARHMRDS